MDLKLNGKTELPPDWQGRRRFPVRDLDTLLLEG